MACQPFSLVQCQREGSPGEGANWTSDDGISPPQTTWTMRGRFLVTTTPGYDTCTGWMHFEYSLNGGNWSEFGYTKFAEPGLLNWYEHPHTITGHHGEYRYRVRLEYDGYEWLTEPFTLTTSGEGRDEAVAELQNLSQAAEMVPRSQDAEVMVAAETVGAAARAQEAAACAAASTAGSSSVTEEATLGDRSETAGLATRSIAAELPEHSSSAGAAPRAAEATAADRAQFAGTV